MTARAEAAAAKFPGETYQIEATKLQALFRISCRLNDGTILSPDERRDLAQRMQAVLTTAERCR